MIEIEKYKNHDIVKNGDEYLIIWDRGKKYFGYNVTESLAEKSRKSDKDALEVMFYLENKRLPKEKELENYNKTDVKRYVGDNFVIYEENGKYEIGIEKEDGGAFLGEVYYPITKELKEKALRSGKDAYEVMRYAETGRWPTNNQDETDRDFIREFPELVLKNPERCKKLFSKEEYEDFKYIIKQRAERIKNGKDINSSTFYYDKNLEKGDPLLFQVKDGKMAEHLAFSEIPRLRYKFSPLDLVPEEFRPGDSLKNLSFSERLFGTTGDTTKKDEEKKDELVALSGRVFFEDAKNYKPKMIDNGNPVTLKAFGEPHPTLTTFYLDNIEKNYNENKGVNIRGRKFYWHHKEKIGKPFSEYRKSVEMPKDKNGQNKFAYNSSLELMDINNEFEFNVNFENLTDEELGVLIYAMEREEGLLHKVGKGKAVGFGSCKIEIKEFWGENKGKYKDFLIEPFEKESKKEDYINKAKEKRYFDEKRKNIKELKAILAKTNDLDFSESPFPEDINKKGETNSLNWFVNNKKGDRKIVLLSILDKNPK